MNQNLTYDFGQPIALVNQSGVLISLCSIFQGLRVPDALGQVDLQDLTAVSGLQNIPCVIAAFRPMTPDKGAEIHYEQSIDTINWRHVLLNAYYPLILQQYIAVIDGTRYEIIAVESDSQQTMTRLAVRLYQK